MLTLLSAFRHLFSNLGEVSSLWLPLVPYSETIFISLWALIEYQFLRLYDATFAENFFGLRRALVLKEGRKSTSAASNQAPQHKPDVLVDEIGQRIQDDPPIEIELSREPLSRVRRFSSLLFTVLIPYLRSRIEHHVRILQESEQDTERRPLSFQDRILLRLYPYVHATWEFFTLLDYALYVLNRSCFFSFLLRIQRLALVRLKASEYRLHSKRPFGGNLRFLLIILVLTYKALDWWHHSERDEISAHDQMEGDSKSGYHSKIPPPPTLQPTCDLGNPSACPICRKKITNSTLNVASGYVFCYPCIRQHVEDEGKCPVTGVRTIPEQLRRLYEHAG